MRTSGASAPNLLPALNRLQQPRAHTTAAVYRFAIKPRGATPRDAYGDPQRGQILPETEAGHNDPVYAESIGPAVLEGMQGDIKGLLGDDESAQVTTRAADGPLFDMARKWLESRGGEGAPLDAALKSLLEVAVAAAVSIAADDEGEEGDEL